MLFSNYISEPNTFKRTKKSLSRKKKELDAARRAQAYRFLLLLTVGIFCYWLPQTLLAPEFHNHDYSTVVQKTKKSNITVPIQEMDKSSTKYADIAIYQFPNGENPKVFETYRTSLLLWNESDRFETIENTHKNALLHFGTWIVVRDLEGKILFLKRGHQLKTCANAWGMVGEHTSGRELIDQTIERGVKEELGEALWTQSVDYTKNLTSQDLPLYLSIHYDNESGRIDEQITWLMMVQLNKKHEELEEVIKFDDEVAEHAWRTKNESIKWMQEQTESDFCNADVYHLLELTLDLVP